jgi:hypothetical protein
MGRKVSKEIEINVVAERIDAYRLGVIRFNVIDDIQSPGRGGE